MEIYNTMWHSDNSLIDFYVITNSRLCGRFCELAKWNLGNGANVEKEDNITTATRTAECGANCGRCWSRCGRWRDLCGFGPIQPRSFTVLPVLSPSLFLTFLTFWQLLVADLEHSKYTCIQLVNFSCSSIGVLFRQNLKEQPKINIV